MRSVFAFFVGCALTGSALWYGHQLSSANLPRCTVMQTSHVDRHVITNAICSDGVVISMSRPEGVTPVSLSSNNEE